MVRSIVELIICGSLIISFIFNSGACPSYSLFLITSKHLTMVSRLVEQMRSSQRKRRWPADQIRLVKVGDFGILFLRCLIFHPLGTDHQRIVKLDRENEVAPPPKVLPSVGRVRILLSPIVLWLKVPHRHV